MIIEITDLPLRAGTAEAFRIALTQADTILKRQPGYIGHQLARQVEFPNTFTLIIRWRSLEAHTEAFAKSADFADFLALIGGFVEGPTRVIHAKPLEPSDAASEA